MSDKSKKAEALLKLNGIRVMDRTALDNAVLFSRHGEVGNAAIELLDMRSQLAALRAERDRLREALRPFAEMAAHFPPEGIGNRPTQNEDPIYDVSTGGLPDARYTVGDLRRAADALKGA